MSTTDCNWFELSEKIKATWSRLTESDIEAMQWNLDLVVNKLKKHYGYTREQAQRELQYFKVTLSDELRAKVIQHSVFQYKDDPPEYSLI